MPSSLAARASLVVIWLAAVARASGPYLGGGLGKSRVQDTSAELPAAGFNETGRAWKVFTGYRFDEMPVIHWATEGGYRDSGRIQGDVGGVPASYRLKGWDYAVLPILPLGRLEIFGRAGGISYQLDRWKAGEASPRDGQAFLYGGGLGADVLNFHVRFDYERMNIPGIHRSDTVWLLLQTKSQ